MPGTYLQRGTWLLVLACALGAGALARGQDSSAPKVKPADVEKAERAYLAGARMIERHELAGAQAQFEQAAKLDPTRRDYKLAFDLTREHRVSELVQRAAKARMTDQPVEANALLAEAKAVDPANERVLEHDLNVQDPAAGKASITPTHDVLFAPPIHIEPDGKAHDLHLRGNARTAMEQAAATYGIKVAFDSSVTPGPGESALAQVRVDLEQSPYEQAMPILLKMTHMFGVAVEPKLLLIAKDTQENRARLERQLEETIYVPASTPEQLNELTNVVKNVFDVKQVVVAQSSGTISVRAPEPTLTALNETLEGLIDGGSEVVIESKLVMLDRSHTLNVGLNTPTSIGAFNAYGEAQTLVNANQALVQTLISSGAYVPTSNAFQNTIAEALLLVLSGAVQDAKLTNLVAIFGNGPVGLTGVFLGSGVSFNLGLTSSDAKALDDITVRAGDRQMTTLRIGERYPIVTATFNSPLSSATASQLSGININGVPASTLLAQLNSAANATPQVQYEDLGITLKATPTVMKSGMVDLKIDLKIEALTGQTLDGIPVLTSRVFTSDVTVPDGDSAVMMSDLSKTEAASISGLPGLGELPGFQETLAETLRDVADSELVLVLTPHVIRHRLNLVASRRIPFSTSVPAEF